MSIAQRGQKIKLLLDGSLREWGLPVLVLLVGLASFGLGRLSALETALPPVSIQKAPILDSPQGMYLGGQFVASKTGTVYYYPWCAQAQKIAPEAQVWFATEAQAQAAGYRPAKNCKGLVSS